MSNRIRSHNVLFDQIKYLVSLVLDPREVARIGRLLASVEKEEELETVERPTGRFQRHLFVGAGRRRSRG